MTDEERHIEIGRTIELLEKKKTRAGLPTGKKNRIHRSIQAVQERLFQSTPPPFLFHQHREITDISPRPNDLETPAYEPLDWPDKNDLYDLFHELEINEKEITSLTQILSDMGVHLR